MEFAVSPEAVWVWVCGVTQMSLGGDGSGQGNGPSEEGGLVFSGLYNLIVQSFPALWGHSMQLPERARSAPTEHRMQQRQVQPTPLSPSAPELGNSEPRLGIVTGGC